MSLIIGVCPVCQQRHGCILGREKRYCSTCDLKGGLACLVQITTSQVEGLKVIVIEHAVCGEECDRKQQEQCSVSMPTA